MVVNNDADKGWTSIFDKLKKSIPEINAEVADFIDLLKSDPESSLWNTNELVDFAKECKVTDETFLSFLKTWDGTGDIAEQYQKHLNSASSSTSKFAATLKTVAANIAIMTVINIAIKAVTTAWDNFNETVEESRAKVDNITGKLENLNTELSELKNEQNKTQYDHMRIRQLEAEIKLQERLLEIEQKRLYENQIGTTFSDYFDKDSLLSKKTAEENKYNKEGYEYLSNKYSKTQSAIDSLNKDISNLQNRLKAGLIEEYYKPQIEEEVNKLIEERDKLLSEQVSVEEQLALNSAEYLSNYQAAQEAIKSGLLTGEALSKAQEMSDFWNQMYIDSMNIVTSIQKANGTFDNSSVIRDILAKADFQKTTKELEDLGKSGRLSVDTLSSRFPALISYLNKAGVKADELYQYIMKLSNPDAINYNETERMLKESLGIRDGEIGGASDQKKWDEIRSSFDDDEWQIALEAYLTVRDQYGEHPEGWNVRDWIAHIQSELENNALKIEAKLDEATISSSVNTIAKQLEPQFAKLGESYKAIFTSDGFKLDDVDNSMLEGLRQSFAEIEEGLGVTFDASVLNPFFDTLTNGSSTADQVQQAFNELATSYLYSTEVMSQLNDETATAIEKQLYEMGVVNAHEVVTEALAQKKLELAAANEYATSTGDDLANASGTEIAVFAAELEVSGQLTEELAQLLLQKALLNGITINTAADIDNLYNLALQAGATVETLNALAAAKANFGSTGSAKLDSLRAQKDAHFALKDTQVESKPAQVKLDFNPARTGGKSGGASKAGKNAADEYLEAFNKELEKLKDLKDRGKITEKEYLDQLRVLYLKYFKDKKKYLDQYQKYENDYLQGMKSLYQKAFSAVTKILDKQIDSYEKQKKSAVDALEAEQKARKENLEAQKEALQEQIDSIDKQIEIKNKIIDSINDEIDAIKDANEERQREIDLQKKKYELERSQNQRPILQYSEEKGMHYVNDPKAIRDAQQDIDDAETEKEIADKEKQIKLIEKEISVLEDRKTVLEDQQDIIDKQIDALDKYYDNLIDNTEQYWDSLINGMEQYKSRWDELAEIEEQAELDAIFKQLGLSTQDVLAMSDEAFQKFKGDYLGLLLDIYAGNDQMIESIGKIANVDMSGITSYLVQTQEYINSLNGLNLGDTASQLEGTATAVDKIAKASESAARGTSATAESMAILGTSASGISTDIDTIANSLESISGAENIEAAAKALANMAEAIERISKAFGLGEEDSVGGLISSLNALSELSLENENGESIVSQFDTLKASVEGVSSAISGGGSSGGDSTAGNGKTSTAGKKESNSESSGSSLISSIEELKTKANETLGTGEEDNTGIIGQFSQIEQKVTDVTTAIGNGEEDGEQSSSNSENKGTLISSIKTLGDTSSEVLGEPGGEGVIGKFEQMEEPLLEANEHVTGISDGLAEIDGQEVECTIKVTIEQNGELPAHAEGTLGDMNLKSGEYTTQYGKAFAKGTGKYKGLPKAEKNALVSELGQTEMTVLPNGKTIITNEPTMMDLPKDTVIFNEEQTKQIINNKPQVTNGTYVSKTIPYQPTESDTRMEKALSKVDGWLYNGTDIQKSVASGVVMGMEQMERRMDDLTRNTTFNNIAKSTKPSVHIGDINVTCPGVTEQQVAERLGGVIGKELDKQFSGFHNYTDQMSRIR